MNTWILLWECIIKLFTIWIFSHMTHVLKIGKSRAQTNIGLNSSIKIWVGFIVLIPSTMDHSQLWHLVMAKVGSFCHLKLKIQNLWWLLHVYLLVCPLLILLLNICLVSSTIFLFVFLDYMFVYVFLCLHLSIYVCLYFLLFSSLCFYFCPMSAYVQCKLLFLFVYLCLDFVCVWLYLLMFAFIYQC
jgi:hypothetical protein